MDLVVIYAFLKSNRRVIAGWAIAAVMLALVYAFTATPLYTATAVLRLDSKFKANDQMVAGNSPLDSSPAETEAEVLRRSDSIALAVVKNLNLTDDRGFIDTSPGLFATIFGETFRGTSEYVRQRIAVKAIQDNLTIRRVGLTDVLDVSFRSPDREKAARIANAIVDAYIVNQLDAKYQATLRAGNWLQDRIRDLRDQASAEEQAVVDYRLEHNIIDAAGQPTSGQWMTKRVAELNSQLIIVRAQTPRPRLGTRWCRRPTL
jgi:polysaccharide biosynthesis transport protein